MNVLPRESETRRWYEEKVREYGYDYRGLGFRTRSAQERRFEALMRLGPFNGRRLLDVGCGFGDFLEFLHERDIKPDYMGLDICTSMIARCHQRFPVSSGLFAVCDVLDYQPRAPFDYVVASGIFGLDAPNARERILPSLERMFRWCRSGVAVNFLSARSPSKVENRVYVDPAEALEWGMSIAPAASLDHSYLPNDFTLLMHRTPTWLEASSGEVQ